ncbi:MAG: DOMON-like domain-containing protein [Spirulina sp.]
MQKFSLVPFQKTPYNLILSGTISRCDRFLCLHYQLEGDLENLLIPDAIDRPSRKHELWQETCFEFFLRLQNSPQYWEFNLSPSGHWNVYHFDDYRKGMKEETRFVELPFLVREGTNRVLLEIEIDLAAIASPDRVLEVAVSTVTKGKNGDIIYWALTHPQKQADFHHQESFTLTLEANITA